MIAAALALCGTLLGASGAFASSSASPTWMTYITGLPTSPQVWVALSDGSSPSQLGNASSAQISPNGAEVAAVSLEKQSNAWTLTLYPTPAGTPTTLIPKRPQPMSLLASAWSPDSRLVLVTVGTSPAQLMVVDTTTQQSHTIATGAIYGASFAPGSSDAIVYARSRAGKSAVNIYTSNATGGDTRELTHDGHSELPLWAPSGIVYSHETARAKNPYPELQLWLMNPDGTGAHQITDINVGKQEEGLVAVDSSVYGPPHLLANLVGPTGVNITVPYTVDLSTAKPAVHQLTSGPGYIGDAISTHGDAILVTKGTASNLKTLSVETYPWGGGKPTTVVKQGGYASWNR